MGGGIIGDGDATGGFAERADREMTDGIGCAAGFAGFEGGAGFSVFVAATFRTGADLTAKRLGDDLTGAADFADARPLEPAFFGESVGLAAFTAGLLADPFLPVDLATMSPRSTVGHLPNFPKTDREPKRRSNIISHPSFRQHFPNIAFLSNRQ